MTSAERTYLEEKIFLQTHLDSSMRDAIKEIYKKYKDALEMFPALHEAKFGMLYCKMILNNNTDVPHSKTIMAYTKETQTSYYMYRMQVLGYIWKTLKSKKIVAD